MVSIASAARITTLSVLSCVLFACNTEPKFGFRLREPDINYLVDQSPVILLGTVTEIKEIGPARPIEDYNVHLQQVNLAVEQVLKGVVAEENTQFYRYAPAEAVLRKAPSPDRIASGTRSIFFLDHENGLLRATIDATRSRVPIASGQHTSQWAAWEKLPIKEQIANAMFAPGDEIDAERFARALKVDSWLSFELIGDLKTLRLLKESMNSGSPIVRATACLQIAHNFEGQYDCLNAIKTDTNLPADLRSEAEQQLKSSEGQDQELLATFTTYPSWWLTHRVGTQDRGAVCERAEVLRQHRNPVIVKKATEFLSSEFPDFRNSGCPPRGPAQP
jgi:hypothetical protein